MTSVRPVARVVEQIDANRAIVEWLYNPVPEGAELLFDHRDEKEDTRLYDPTSHEESPPCTVPDPEDAQ